MQSGKTGFVVKANDRESLLNAMLFFLHDDGLIKAMGESARTFAEQGELDAGETYSTILHSNSMAANY